MRIGGGEGCGVSRQSKTHYNGLTGLIGPVTGMKVDHISRIPWIPNRMVQCTAHSEISYRRQFARSLNWQVVTAGENLQNCSTQSWIVDESSLESTQNKTEILDTLRLVKINYFGMHKSCQVRKSKCLEICALFTVQSTIHITNTAQQQQIRDTPAGVRLAIHLGVFSKHAHEYQSINDIIIATKTNQLATLQSPQNVPMSIVQASKYTYLSEQIWRRTEEEGGWFYLVLKLGRGRVAE